MKKIILFLSVFAISLNSCGSGENEEAIENVLQREWNNRNSYNAGAVTGCNVFNLEVDDVEEDIVSVSYALRTTYFLGDKRMEKYTGATLVKRSKDNYELIDVGYVTKIY